MTRDEYLNWGDTNIFKQWVDGGKLEVKFKGEDNWYECKEPFWQSACEYRIKPPEMITTIQNDIKSAMAVDTVLCTELSRSIMEATGRFEFIKGDDETMIFWDNECEQEIVINPKWTLGKLMRWITNFYSEDFLYRGEQKAQRKMRTAFGLD